MPSDQEIVQAKQLIAKELDSIDTKTLHKDIPAAKKSYLTPALEAELIRKSQNEPIKAIDLERYSKLHTKDSKGTNILDTNRAVVALEYSSYAQENLLLLAEYGRNQWLISNDQLEQRLKRLEEKIQQEKNQIDQINCQRKFKQSEAESTLRYLQDRWRDGLKRVLAVNVACLKLEVERKRMKLA